MGARRRRRLTAPFLDKRIGAYRWCVRLVSQAARCIAQTHKFLFWRSSGDAIVIIVPPFLRQTFNFIVVLTMNTFYICIIKNKFYYNVVLNAYSIYFLLKNISI